MSAVPRRLLSAGAPGGLTSSALWRGSQYTAHSLARRYAMASPFSPPPSPPPSRWTRPAQPRSTACGNPECVYPRHVSQEFGGFCCLKCQWRHVNKPQGGKRHGVLCRGSGEQLPAADRLHDGNFVNLSEALTLTKAEALTLAKADADAGSKVFPWPVQLVSIEGLVYKRFIDGAPFYFFTGVYEV